MFSLRKTRDENKSFIVPYDSSVTNVILNRVSDFSNAFRKLTLEHAHQAQKRLVRA